jgi:hypothetical protein
LGDFSDPYPEDGTCCKNPDNSAAILCNDCDHGGVFLFPENAIKTIDQSRVDFEHRYYKDIYIVKFIMLYS